MNYIIRFFCLIIVWRLTKANNWTIDDENQCFYNVIAVNRTEIETDKIATCGFTEPYVIFKFTNSTVNVPSNFIRTSFNSWIKIFKAVDNIWNDIAPYAFSNLESVSVIDLSSNYVKNVNNMAFYGLSRLDFLNLSRNEMEVITQDTFVMTSDGSNLHLLDLSYNLLSNLPDDVFTNLHRLRILYLQGNKIITIKFELFKPLKHLIFMNLCCNNLTLSNTTLKYLPSLTEIDLSFNSITSLNSNTFSELESLETIDLSHNNIAEFLPLAELHYNINLCHNKMNTTTNYTCNFYSFQRNDSFEDNESEDIELGDIGKK